MAAIFLIMAALVLVLGILYFELQKQSIQKTTQDQLNAVADLKTQMVSTWITDRLGDARMVFENPLFGQQARRIFKWICLSRFPTGYAHLDEHHPFQRVI